MHHAGCFLPGTKAQAVWFLRNNVSMGLLTTADALFIAGYMESFGKAARFKLTNSGAFCRLENQQDLNACYKLKFAI